MTQKRSAEKIQQSGRGPYQRHSQQEYIKNRVKEGKDDSRL